VTRMNESLEQPSPLQNVPSMVSDGTMENSYEGTLLESSPLLMTVNGINYTAEQIRVRLEVFQEQVVLANDIGHMAMFWSELCRRIPDVRTIELKEKR